MFVRPASWSESNSIIYLFGYTPEYKSVYAKIPKKFTRVEVREKSGEDPISNNANCTSNNTNCTSNNANCRFSNLNKDVMITRDYSKIGNSTLESFFESTSIQPYEWLYISAYFFGNEQVCDFNIEAEEENISQCNEDLPDIHLKLLFWEISSCISIITVSKEGSSSYVITTDRNAKFAKNVISIFVSCQKDMFAKFYSIYTIFNPDRMICYNNVEVLMENLILFNIPMSSSISLDNGLKLGYPKTEVIDLASYYNLFCPTSKCQANNIQNNLEKVCNNLKITIKDLLFYDPIPCFEKIMYGIDPASELLDIKYEQPLLPKMTKGIYRSLFVYDYTKIYLDIMMKSKENIAQILAVKLEDAPPKLILTAFYSSVVSKDLTLLQEFFDNRGIVFADKYVVYSTEKIKDCKLVDCLKLCVFINQNTYIVVNDSVEFVTKDDFIKDFIKDFTQEELGDLRNYLLDGDYSSLNKYTEKYLQILESLEAL